MTSFTLFFPHFYCGGKIYDLSLLISNDFRDGCSIAKQNSLEIKESASKTQKCFQFQSAGQRVFLMQKMELSIIRFF